MSLSDLLPPYSVTRRLLTMSKTLSEKIRTKSNARRILTQICIAHDIGKKDRKRIYHCLKHTKSYKDLQKEFKGELSEGDIFIASRMNYLYKEGMGKEIGNKAKRKRIAYTTHDFESVVLMFA